MHRIALCSLWVLVGSSSYADQQPHVVFLIAEREYQTDQTLPNFATEHLAGYRSTFVFADPEDRNRLVGIESIDDADVMIVSVRRRTLPDDQLKHVRNYVAAAKPVIGIRTANHAFCLRNQEPPKGRAQWKSWDEDIFGGNYSNHYGNKLKTTCRLSKNAPRAIVQGLAIGKSFTAGGSLYQVAPLADGAKVALTGAVEGYPPEPIAWTFTRADGGKSFYTSLGHVDDFSGDLLPKLLINAIEWALESK